MELTGKLLDGWGRVVGSGIRTDDDGVITEILPPAEVSGWITPGFIDTHCHGGGGASFPDNPSMEGIETATGVHRALGTTAMFASTVSMVDPREAIKGLVKGCEAGLLAGIHMEGPYISPHKTGAQNPAAVRNPDLDELREWLELGKGWIKSMTIAPEVEGALKAAQMLLDHGAVPSWGHTSANLDSTRYVVERTWEYAQEINFPRMPQLATHLFNAMPPLAHREPGPVRELIAAARAGKVAVEMVADTVHVHPDLVHDVVEYVSEANELGVLFVTDAMEGAGMPDGDYVLGSLAVKIVNGVARLAEGGNIAGGTARLSEEVQRLVRGGHLDLESAVRACVAAPATALGLTNDTAGVTLEWQVGSKPNAVVFNDDLELETVVREGAVITGK